jgi:hypothetical protein
VRSGAGLLGWRVRGVRRDFLSKWLLRRSGVRDHRADRRQLRREGRGVRRLSHGAKLHEWWGRLLVPVVDEGLLWVVVHQHADGREELRQVRERLRNSTSRGGTGDVQLRCLCGARFFVRAGVGALHFEPDGRL